MRVVQLSVWALGISAALATSKFGSSRRALLSRPVRIAEIAILRSHEKAKSSETVLQTSAHREGLFALRLPSKYLKIRPGAIDVLTVDVVSQLLYCP